MAQQTKPKTEKLLEQLLISYENYKVSEGNKALLRHKVLNHLLDLHYETIRTLEKGEISDLLEKTAMSYYVDKERN
jgi:hypothetical protein